MMSFNETMDFHSNISSKEMQLKNIIDVLAKLVELTDYQKQTLLDRYRKMTDLEILNNLSMAIYQSIGPDSPSYDYALSVIRDYNPSICPPVEEMKTILAKRFSNLSDGNMSLEDNHKLILSSLTQFCELFNQYGIDYYVVGALPCFLKTNQPLFRYHDDIDIMVNEEDIPKLKEIIGSIGYKFFDDRFPSIERFTEMQHDKPPHTVLGQNPDNEFHLGFFCFRREQDNSITVREYSHRLENGEVVVDVLERFSGPVGTALRYDETPIIYNGVSFRSSSVENVYILKGYTTRPKDITDMKKLEPYIDKDKLAMLSSYPNQNITIQNIDFPEGVNFHR